MSSNSLDMKIQEIVLREVASIPVPACDPNAIRSRVRELAGAQPSSVSLFGQRRFALVSAVALGLLTLTFPGVSAVVAQVQRAWQAFTMHEGRMVPLDVRVVGLDQARADMPFRVMAPKALPAGLQVVIRELRSSLSPADASLLFEYRDTRSAGGPPRIVITETSVHAASTESDVMFMARPSTGAALPAPEGAKRGLLMQSRRAFKLDKNLWVVDGTKIELLSASGTLTSQDIGEIRDAMSR